jgi:putative zinc-dependent peptidase DUF5700
MQLRSGTAEAAPVPFLPIWSADEVERSKLMRRAGRIAWVVISTWSLMVATRVVAGQIVAAPPRDSPKYPIALRDLVSPGDRLAAQDFHFDASFAQLALEYLRSGDSSMLQRLGKSAAATHLLHHARNFDYDVPKDSSEALVAHLLTPPGKHLEEMETCEQSLAFFSGPMLDDPHWIEDSLRYLPEDLRFHGSLFLTFGYDIGVAIGPTASLNCANPHFKGHPRELMYYAIHELHHVGVMSYQPPPKLSELKTCADLLRLVQYSTQLEGMAVLAAYERRRQEHALADDGDYVAIEDEPRMQRDEILYFEDFHYLEGRAAQAADANAWAVIDRMSSGERLWYRVGARMAQRIEKVSGRTALVELVKQGPARFLEAYRGISGGATKR